MNTDQAKMTWWKRYTSIPENARTIDCYHLFTIFQLFKTGKI